MELSWRKASLDDVRALAQMNAALIEDESGERAPDAHVLRIRLHGWLSRREYHAALFDRKAGSKGGSKADGHMGEDAGGEALAYALWQDRGNEVFLRHFFVDRGHRREGVGRSVMALLERDIWPPDRRVILEVLSDNERGRRFWQALGYLPYSETLYKDGRTGDATVRLPASDTG